jgi:hypothetical protein
MVKIENLFSKMRHARSKRSVSTNIVPPTLSPSDGHEYLRLRRTRLLTNIDLPSMTGLEIGALNNPMVHKSEGKIRYVDFADTETIRGRPYASTINPADIVNVDIVWGDRPLAQAVPEPVDYVIAAHVIEHVPDIIGWLHDIRSVLRNTGVLSLAVPDRRFTFDYRRNESTIGEMVEAYLLGYRRPSIRQVFDHCFGAVVVEQGTAWQRDISKADLPKLVGEDKALSFAFQQCTELAARPHYIDSHCWVFTPSTFLDRLDSLAQLKLLPYRVGTFHSTDIGQLEFLVQLFPEDPHDLTTIRQSIATCRSDLAISPAEQYYESRGDDTSDHSVVG